MALPKSHRLSLRLHRDRLTKTGKTFFGKFFTIVVADSSDTKTGVPHLAILLSKKTANLATNRNKIKRLISAIIENLLPSIPPQDYLVIPKKQVLTEDYKNLTEDLKNLFQK